MQETTRFGPYLLLEKLGEDAFGEVYRAGETAEGGDGPKTLSRHLHLRLFSIPGLDPRALIQALQNTDGLVQGPGLLYASKTGDVGGVPFAAYDYEPRRTLRTLVKEANTGFSDLSLDHAVLIAERLAKGLAVVHQDGKGDRGFHGLITPDLIWVTGDGDIQIAGLEFASVLVPLAQQGRLGNTIRPYLSPELHAGGSAAEIDDIYSIGAILSEMLTGHPPPSDVTMQLSTHLATATVASSGEAIPGGLAELLQRSLLAAKGRTPNAVKWYQQLAEWMGQANLQATHFDLAFFIHELFRDPLQKEKEAVAKEQTRDYSVREDTQSGVQAAAAPAAAAATPQPVSQAPAPIPDATPASGYHPPPPKKSNQGALIAIGAVIFLALAASIFFVTRKPAAPPQQQAATTAPPPPAQQPAEAQAAEAAGLVESDALQVAREELERLMGERSEKLDDEYEDQIRMLKKQLEQAQEMERRETERMLAAPPPPAPAPAPAEQTASNETPAETPAEPAAEPAEEPTTIAQSEEPAELQNDDAPPPPSDTPPVITQQPSKPAVEQAASITPPQPAKVEPPKRLTMPNPIFPDRARRLRKQATVLISVLVASDGSVKEAKPVSDEPVGFGFDQSALSAARRATFKPGTRDGVPTEMWTTVVISFRL